MATKHIRILGDCLIRGAHTTAGAIVELPLAEALGVISTGRAQFTTAPIAIEPAPAPAEVETAAAAPATETAAAPKSRSPRRRA